MPAAEEDILNLRQLSLEVGVQLAEHAAFSQHARWGRGRGHGECVGIEPKHGLCGEPVERREMSKISRRCLLQRLP